MPLERHQLLAEVERDLDRNAIRERFRVIDFTDPEYLTANPSRQPTNNPTTKPTCQLPPAQRP